MFKVNNRNTRLRCEICLKLTIKTPERSHWHRSGVFIINFEHISHPVLVSHLVSIVNFQQVNVGCVTVFLNCFNKICQDTLGCLL